MDRVADLIAQAAAAGLVLAIEGGELRVRGRRDAAEHLMPLLREHKAAFIEALERRANPLPALPARPPAEYPALSWDDLVRRLTKETSALPEPELAPKRNSGPWPSATVELRVAADGRLCSGPLRGPDGAEGEPDGRRREP